jgi:antitoxin (DNA-binding transcriptional repressor) of toxin-antitoxin stability system
MTAASIPNAKNRLAALARSVEQGETIKVTRNRKPIVDLVLPRRSLGWISTSIFCPN